MNLPAVILFSLILFFILALIYVDNYVFGFDYIGENINPKGFTKEPVICIERTDHRYYQIRAVKSWEIELEKYTSSKMYDYRIMVMDKFTPVCDATITFQDPTMIWENTSHLGAAGCGIDSNEKRYCVVAVNWKEYPRERYTTLVHEMGHVLGLGHRLPIDFDNLSSVAGIVLEDDVMFPQASPFDVITKENLDALQYFYNYSGWSGGTARNYTVPHGS